MNNALTNEEIVSLLKGINANENSEVEFVVYRKDYNNCIDTYRMFLRLFPSYQNPTMNGLDANDLQIVIPRQLDYYRHNQTGATKVSIRDTKPRKA